MSECTSAKWIRLTDRLFVDGLGRWRFRRLRRHLGGCARCRAYYDKVALAWRAMGPGATPPVVAEALADELVGALPRPRRFPWLAGAAAAAAVAAAAAWMIAPRFSTGEWRERGGAVARARGVRAFCLGADGGEVAVRGSVAAARDGAPPSLRCPLGGSLQFAYTLGDGAPETLTLVGRDSAGREHPYATALPLRPGSVDEPLPTSVRLAVNHAAGPVTVDAFFSDGPTRTDHQQLTLSLDP